MIKGNKEIHVFFSVYIDLSGLHEPFIHILYSFI